MTLPLDDLIAHDAEDCVCGPVLVPVVAGTGERSEITIHRRLDGGWTCLSSQIRRRGDTHG